MLFNFKENKLALSYIILSIIIAFGIFSLLYIYKMPKPLNIDCMSVDGHYSFGIKIPNAKYSNHLISGEIFVPDLNAMGFEVDKAYGKILYTEDSFYQDASIVQFGNHDLIRILNDPKKAVYIPQFGSRALPIPLICFKLKK